MKGTGWVLFGLLILVSLAMPTTAATGQQCNNLAAQVTVGGTVFEANWCGPSEASVGSDFQTTLQTQLSVGGLTLTIPAASGWTYVGCSYVSATTGGGTLTASTIARVTMDAPTCTITTSVAVLPLIGPALGNFPVLFSIYDPTADLPTDFNNNVTGQLDVDVLTWPQLNASITSWPTLFNSVNITDWPQLDALVSGDLELNITDIPTLELLIQEWPTLFANVTVSEWPTLFATLNGSLDLNLSDLTVNVASWPTLFNSVNITDWPQLDALVSGDLELNITDIPTLELLIQEWPTLFANVNITEWPTLFSVLSGTVEVTGVEIGDVNTTVGNITNEASQSGLQAATGLDGPDWLPLLFLLLAAILIWHRTKDPVMLNLMGVMALFVGIVLLFVYAAVLWPGLLALGLISSVVGAYMILRTNIEEFSKG